MDTESAIAILDQAALTKEQHEAWAAVRDALVEATLDPTHCDGCGNPLDEANAVTLCSRCHESACL